MFTCSVGIDQWSVVFRSSRVLVPAFLRLAETPAFLGFRVIEGELPGCCYKVNYEECEQINVAYTSHSVTIRAPWKIVCEGETLLYASLPFLELQRQHDGFVTAHAAAVAFPNSGAALILGKEGSGKTTTALGLCRSFGARLIGNDLVILGLDRRTEKIVARGGTKFLWLRYESIRRNIPDLLHLFPHKEEDSWLRKVIVSPSEANIDICDREVLIQSVFLVHVDETKSNVFVKSADSTIIRLYLNENFSRYIRNTCTTLMGEKSQFLGYVPSFDTEALYKKRVVLMEKILKDYSMKYVSGPLEMVIKHIATQN